MLGGCTPEVQVRAPCVLGEPAQTDALRPARFAACIFIARFDADVMRVARVNTRQRESEHDWDEPVCDEGAAHTQESNTHNRA